MIPVFYRIPKRQLRLSGGGANRPRLSTGKARGTFPNWAKMRRRTWAMLPKTSLLSANNPEIAARLRRRVKSLTHEWRTRCSQSAIDWPDKNATTRSLVGSRVGQTRQGAENRDCWMPLVFEGGGAGRWMRWADRIPFLDVYQAVSRLRCCLT